MNNNEAIEILTEVKDFDDSMYQYNPKYMKALDMAIKALENEEIIKRDVWELYQRYQPNLATNVYKFGVELKELLYRYEGGRQ